MTENELLSRELLTFLSSHPQKLKDQGQDYAGQLAIQLGNALLALSYTLEKGQPQVWQPLDECPQSLFALGKQFREVGLTLWPDPKQASDPVVRHLERDVEFLKTRLTNLERQFFKQASKGGAK